MRRIVYNSLKLCFLLVLFVVALQTQSDAVYYSCQYSVEYEQNGVSIFCSNICASTLGDYYGLCQFSYDKRVENFHLTGMLMVPVHFNESTLDLSFNAMPATPLRLQDETTRESYEIRLENVYLVLDTHTLSLIDADGSVLVNENRMNVKPIKETVFRFLWF